MKPPCFSTVFVLALAVALPAQNVPPAPVPAGAGAGSTPSAPAAAATAEATSPVDPEAPDALKHYGLDRYDKIVEKSPFNFKIVKPQAGPEISFAADLSLAGFTRDVGKGIIYASLWDKKKNTRIVINDQSPHKETGIQLVKLNRKPGDTLIDVTILARKGGEEREIKAEKTVVDRPAVVAATTGGRPGQTGPVAGGPGMGNVPGQRGGPGPRGPNQVQQEINQNLQPPTPGPNPQAAGGGQPPPGGAAIQTVNAQAAGGPAQPTVAPTVADVQMQRQNPAAPQTGRDGQTPAPNKRRVILPPPVPAQ